MVNTDTTTRLTCPSCAATYEVAKATIEANQSKGGRLRCTECGHVFSITASTAIADPTPQASQAASPIEASKTASTATKPSSHPFERKDPTLGYSPEGQERLAKPRRVGFTNTGTGAAGMQTPTPAYPPNSVPPLASPAIPQQAAPATAQPDPLMERIENQIQNAANAGEKKRTNRFMASLLTILLFFVLLAALVYWILTQKPDWARPSYWFNVEQSAQGDGQNGLQPNVEAEIAALPLVKPKITGQRISTRDTDEENISELDLGGVVQNASDSAIRLEMMRAIALDENGEVIRSWTFSPGARTLAPREVLPFSNRTPLESGQREIIKFGWQSDIAKLPEVIAVDQR